MDYRSIDSVEADDLPPNPDEAGVKPHAVPVKTPMGEFADHGPAKGVTANLEGRREVRPVRDSQDDISEAALHSERDARFLREIEVRDRRLADLERTCKAAVRDRELATLLAGKSLVAGAANQLIKLWRDEFDVYEEEGVYKVATRDGRAVGQVVNEWLASPDYLHFSLPAVRGGAGAKDASKQGGAATGASAPRNLGEAVVKKWREESAMQPENLLKPIGLRRHR